MPYPYRSDFFFLVHFFKNYVKIQKTWGSLVAQEIKNLPSVQENQVQSLGWEDPLEEGMATHSSILAWRILWTEEPGELQSMGLQRVRHDWATNTSTLSLTHTVKFPISATTKWTVR